MLVVEILAAVSAGRTPVVLTERTEHLEILASALRSRVQHVITLQGGMGRKSLTAALEQLRDIPQTEPRGSIAQYVGRLHRLHDGKSVVQVHDYADLDVPMLLRMFDRRCAGYEAVGYTLLLPASALPGWPANVPLPIDSQWKNDYAASVQRLIRDGVDQPLATLFVHATRSLGDSTDRARSASEAFLFRRLETLPALAGKFRLNTKLPIPFDGFGEMEIDLLSEAHRIAIEIDGPQHLTPEHYRRDRRKDMLLQTHDYIILRFLAEDLGKHLDAVLDAIHRVIAARKL